MGKTIITLHIGENVHSWSLSSASNDGMADLESDVIVIGAGVAGLAAAVRLRRARLRVRIVEARDRIGGRIWTRHDPLTAAPMELGAEFVHGRPPELLRLIRDAGMKLKNMPWKDGCFRHGRIGDCGDSADGSEEILDNMKPPAGGDCSFDQYLRGVRASAEAKKRATGYVEGFNAADKRRISVRALLKQQQAEEEIAGDSIQRVAGGYDGVPAALWRGLRRDFDILSLNTVVTQVHWRRGRVEVIAKHASGIDPRPFTARFAVITLPLGVLQSGTVRFLPKPRAALEAARNIVMGPVIRVSLLFSRWPSPHFEKLSFLHAEGEPFRTWWTQAPSREPLLTAWSGGPAALRNSGKPAERIARVAIESLARMVKQPAARLARSLVSFAAHDWQADPFSRGAYTYIPVGGIDAPAALANPVEDTLWFAGEASDTRGHYGTVHAALASGDRAAREILGRRNG